MNKIFSYSLFEPKLLPEHRTWDKWKTEQERYWYNIPTILLMNSILFPDYLNVIHVSQNIMNNKLSKIFDFFDNLKIETIDRDYNITEPAIWRMMPVWQRGVDIVHCRDLDSISTIEDYKFIKQFEISDCSIGTIRSHENHYGIACRMLAGLSSFKPSRIPLSIKGINFDFYYSQRRNEYGSDQNLMIKTFTTDHNFTSNNFLDCRIDKQNNYQDFPCLRVDLTATEAPLEVKQIYNSLTTLLQTEWLGEPCDSRGAILKYLLEKNKDIKDKFLLHKEISDFYKV